MLALGVTPSVGDGTTTAFTLSAVPVGLIVFTGGTHRTDYTLVGAVFTLSAAPVAGEPVNAYSDGTAALAGSSSTAASPRSYVTSELLASIRQRTFTAGSSRDFDDASLLRTLNEQIGTYLLKLIVKRRTNYLVESVDVSVANGTSQIPIPSVAMAGAVRAATLLVGGIPYPLIEMDLPTAVATALTPLSTQFPTGYYWQGPYIVVWPSQSLNGTLRLHYHRRPSRIVSESQCVQITSFPGGAAAGNYRVQFAAVPSGFSTGTPVDVVSNSPNFYRWQTSQPITAITSSTMDIPGTQPSNLAAGDWICLAGTAPVVSDAPAEVIEALLQRTALKMMEGKGADDSMQRLERGLTAAEEDCGPLIQARNTGAQRKLSAFPDAAVWPFGGWG